MVAEPVFAVKILVSEANTMSWEKVVSVTGKVMSVAEICAVWGDGELTGGWRGTVLDAKGPLLTRRDADWIRQQTTGRIDVEGNDRAPVRVVILEIESMLPRPEYCPGGQRHGLQDDACGNYGSSNSVHFYLSSVVAMR